MPEPWEESYVVYPCGCRWREQVPGQPVPENCLLHDMPPLRLTCTHMVNGRPMSEGRPVSKVGSVDDMLRDLERELGLGRIP